MAKRAKHEGEHPVNCPFCITEANRKDLFGRGYIEVLARDISGAYARKHKAAMARRENEVA